MKAFLLLLLICITTYGQNHSGESFPQSSLNISAQIMEPSSAQSIKDTTEELVKSLENLINNTSNKYFKLHCISILNFIKWKGAFYPWETSLLNQMYITFSSSAILANASQLSSYLERKRPFIVTWKLKEDGVMSLGWLLPPLNWDPEKAYPLYVMLHGAYSSYSYDTEYMTYYFQPQSVMSTTFEDGYTFFPWGRGNLWYEGIAEKDIWGGLAAVDTLVKINPSNKFLVGHSMGGYGVWALGQKSTQLWAGLGIYAGALNYFGSKYLNAQTAEKLKDIPVYIVCGDKDGFLGYNQTAFNLLKTAGNSNIKMTTFSGGHEALLNNWQGMYEWLKNFSNVTATEEFSNSIPKKFHVNECYPNPFNPTTTISYALPYQANVKIEIYNMTGQKITTLKDEIQNAGRYKLTWNAEALSSGIYLCRINAEMGKVFSETKKVILLK